MIKYTYRIIQKEQTVDITVKKIIDGKTEKTVEQRTIPKKYIVADDREYQIPYDVEYATSKKQYSSCLKNMVSQYENVTTDNIEQIYDKIMNLIDKIRVFDIAFANKNGILAQQHTDNTLDGEPIGEYVMRVLKSKISYKDYLPLSKQHDRKWLTALKRLMPVLKLKKDSHKHAANIIQHFISNIRHYAGDTEYKAYHNEQIPFLYSEGTGGTGKGMFINAIVEYCNKTFGECSTTTLNDFGISEYSSALLAYKSEGTFFKMNDLLNDVFDNVVYKTNEKYKARIDLKSKVTSILASNKLLSDSNTRRFGIIEYEPLAPYNEWTEEQQAKYGLNENMQQYVADLFEYCPKEPLFKIEKTKSKSEADSRIEDVLADHIDIVEAYVKNNTQVTPTRLMKDFGENKMLQHFDKIQYVAFINNRILAHEMTKIKSSNTKARFTKSYLTKLSIMNMTQDDYAEVEEATVESMVDDSIREWDKLINEFDDKPTNNYETFDKNKPVTDIIDNALECKDKFDTDMKPLTNSQETEFMMLGVNKPGHTGRKQEDIVPTGFVFEFDEIPMYQQENIMNNTVENPLVNDVCFSGHKSLHFHILMKPTEMTNDEYKYCWKYLANKLFGTNERFLDVSTSNMNRLTRKPNAIRKANGVKQVLVYYSTDRHYFDPTDCLKEYRKLFEMRPSITYESTSSKGVEYLKACWNKNHKETIKLALDALENKQIPSGANMIGTLAALKAMNVDKSIIQQVADVFHKQHPSNISLSTMKKYSE